MTDYRLTKIRAALESAYPLIVFDDETEDCFTKNRHSLEVADKIKEALAILSDIENTPTQTGWRRVSEWHDDYGDCLFMFFCDGGDFYCGDFTSPLSSRWDEKYGWCKRAYFKRIDTSDLPAPPVGGGEG